MSRTGSTGHQLVPMIGKARTDGDDRPAASGRPLAAFLTQLVACAIGAEAFRQRRREVPAVAAARYGGHAGSQPGTRLNHKS